MNVLGLFHGHTKAGISLGEGLGKDWGRISADTYRPGYSWVNLASKKRRHTSEAYPRWSCGASGADTKQDFRERPTEVISCPPVSPDSNFIERGCLIMKNYHQENFLEVVRYDVLRSAVKEEAWENVGWYEFEVLIQSMPAGCQAVNDANGLITKYSSY
jgi:hypothetical protein